VKQNLKRTKFACYAAYFTMSSIFCVPPLLYVTFHEAYGISFTVLGTLVVANFLTQLGIDFIYSAFSQYWTAFSYMVSSNAGFWVTFSQI
jgi:hypothetical protein